MLLQIFCLYHGKINACRNDLKPHNTGHNACSLANNDRGSQRVYRKKTVQRSFELLEEALGTPLSPNNCWVPLAETIPWAEMEEV